MIIKNGIYVIVRRDGVRGLQYAGGAASKSG